MNRAKYSRFLRTVSVFSAFFVMLSLFFYVRAEEVSFGSVIVDENGITYSLDKETLTACVILGGESASAVIPERVTADGVSFTVVSVGQRAFCENSGVKSVQLPDTVTYIGDGAFFGCVSLESVTAEGLLSAGCDTFTGTPFITKEEFVCLGGVLLRYNGKAPLVTDIPSVTFVADAFAYNCSIRTVILPDTVRTVGAGAFAMAQNLKNVNLPFSTESIGDKAFFGCVSLSGISITAGVRAIGEGAFSGTPYLAQLMEAEGDTVVLGDGVLVRYKGNDESVTLPTGIKYVSDAFAYSSVRSVTLPSGCIIGKGAFRNAESLYKVKINGNFSDVGDFAFSGCFSLEILSVKGSFSGSIGFGAFDGTPDSFAVYFRSTPSDSAVFEKNGIPVLSPSKLAG